MSNKLIVGSPAPYPKTAAAEQDSKNIFQSLLDSKYVKGDLRIMDKYPNSDGILEITDDDQVPIGKIDIQLKTLESKNYNKPKYQCDSSLLSYAENSTLPLILVAVDRDNKRAYWRHIDRQTIIEISSKIKGKSFSLAISRDNCIDGENITYIQEWSNRVREIRDKVWNYDELLATKYDLEEVMQSLQLKLKDPSQLPEQVLKEFHVFLDRYNYILDREFPFVKEYLYPEYWKIGIGIFKYEFDRVNFLLFPVKFKDEQTLVKKVAKIDYGDIYKEMLSRRVLLIGDGYSSLTFKSYPDQTAYKLLETNVRDTIKKYGFPLPDEFLAQEYLIAFIDTFAVYLDVGIDEFSYPLKELRVKLFSILPIVEATNRNFADGVTEHQHLIDSNDRMSKSVAHQDRIKDAEKLIAEGKYPEVAVTLRSQKFNLDIVRYYISYLEGKQYITASRQYKLNQYDRAIFGRDIWKAWNIDVLWQNAIIFFENFQRIYALCVHQYFPVIESHLQIKNVESTLAFVLVTKFGEPFILCYHLRPHKPSDTKILFFKEDDTANQLYSINFLNDDDKNTCEIDGKLFEVTRIETRVLNFMFKKSPTYHLLIEILSEEVRKYFVLKSK